MKVFIFVCGVVLGGLFFNAKFTEAAPNTVEKEVVYGTRIGPDGTVMLVKHR